MARLAPVSRPCHTVLRRCVIPRNGKRVAFVMPEGGGRMRCARCHCQAAYTARRHTITFGICLRHHQAVWRALVQDGWIISPATRRLSAAA